MTRRRGAGEGHPPRFLTGTARITTGMLCARPPAGGKGATPIAPTDLRARTRFAIRWRKAAPRSYGLAVAVPEITIATASRPGDNAATAMKSVVAIPALLTGKATCRSSGRLARLESTRPHVRGLPVIRVRHRARRSGTLRRTHRKDSVPYDPDITAVELLPVFQFDAQDAPQAA